MSFSSSSFRLSKNLPYIWVLLFSPFLCAISMLSRLSYNIAKNVKMRVSRVMLLILFCSVVIVHSRPRFSEDIERHGKAYATCIDERMDSGDTYGELNLPDARPWKMWRFCWINLPDARPRKCYDFLFLPFSVLAKKNCISRMVSAHHQVDQDRPSQFDVKSDQGVSSPSYICDQTLKPKRCIVL